MGIREFKFGDLVRLKSDGPKMTVLRVKDNRGYLSASDQDPEAPDVEVRCVWFVDGVAKVMDFPAEALVLLEFEEVPAEEAKQYQLGTVADD